MQLFQNSKTSSSNSPYYYSKTSFGFMGPVAVVYSLVSRLLFKIFPVELPSSQTSQLLPKPPETRQSRQNKVAIITGSNTGIGYETARSLVIDHNYTVIMACRSRDKALEAISRIEREQQQQNDGSSSSSTGSTGGKAVFVHPLDLSCCQSITKFAEAIETSEYATTNGGIDCLINNAGRNTNGPSIDIAGNRKLDLLFMSNFLGHYLLTFKLMKLLLMKNKNKNGGRDNNNVPRIINLSSVMHHFVGNHHPLDSTQFWIDCATADDSKYKHDVYSLSKLAALLFSQELNTRYSGQIQSITVNPGAVNSDIWRGFPRWIIPIFKLLYLTPSQGCHPVISAATARDFTTTDTANESDTVYLQPYWIPGANTKPPFPVFEMMGPYAGTVRTAPRLPPITSSSSANANNKASTALWMACQKLLPCNWPDEKQ